MYGLLGCLGFLAVAAGFGYWRLSQGPLSIGFLSGPLEDIINSSLDGMRIRVRDAVIERDSEANTIHLRLREAQLEDMDGQLIARAPRAAVGLSGSALFSGELRPERLEFIGPRILVRRTIDGALELGFGDATHDGGVVDTPTISELPPSDEAYEELEATDLQQAGESLFARVLDRFIDASGTDTTASQIMSISITNAAVSIYDEINDAIWYAPKTNLVFQRVPYGISLLAYGQVASGAEPFSVQIAADYVSETEHISANVKVANFIPAHISDQVFVLSDLAKVDLPITGSADLRFDRAGNLLAASASFEAGAGLVGFPRYISQSLLVDEGVFNLTYVPETGAIEVEDSSLFVGGSRATLNGSISPVHNAAGSVESLQYELIAQNVSLDTDGTLRDQLAIDRFELRGLAALEEGRLDVETLALRAGDASIQVRGTFIEGPEVPAVFLRGVMHDIPLPMLMKLWPPDAAIYARQWIADHVIQGTVTEGRLSVNLQSQALAAALDEAPVPNDQLTLTFQLEDVETNYFGSLPPLQNASGEGRLRGNDFEVNVTGGEVNLDTGQQLVVSAGRFFVEDLTEPGTIGHITAEISGDISAALRLIDHEPLRYARAAEINPETIGGHASSSVDIRLPMLSNVTFEQVEIGATTQLSSLQFPGVFQGADVQGGDAVLEVNKEGLAGHGRVVVNGVASDVRWWEDFTVDPSRSQRIQASAVLSEADRQRLNIDLSRFLTGPVTVNVSADERDSAINSLRFSADLSNTEMFINAIGWRRQAGEGATATFDLDVSNSQAYRISNLDIDGPDHLSIDGTVTLDAQGALHSADLGELSLGPGNRLALTARRDGPDNLVVQLNGDSFDARPMIGSVFRRREGGDEAATSGSSARGQVTLEGQISTMFLHNHEHLSNVSVALRSDQGALQNLNLVGTFADGQPLELTVAPQEDGNRTLAAETGNAGALLRAVDLYSRVSGGTLKLDAVLGPHNTGEFRSGRLRVNDFDVIDEPALANLAGSVQNNQSSSQGTVSVTSFDRLRMSFLIDATHFRIVDEAIVFGATIGASARGTIGRDDASLNLAGTLTPAYALNAVLGNVPILGEALLGGQGQGLIGVTFAVTGTMAQPRVTINPVSALAPGFLRRIFEFGNAPTQRSNDPSFDNFEQFEQFEDSTNPRPFRLER